MESFCTAATSNWWFSQRGDVMYRVTRLMGLGILGLALAVGVGTSGDTKKDKDKEPGKEKTPPLPPGWKALKLSKDQLSKVHGIMADYKGKIVDLEKKVAELKSQERADMIKVLTD